MHGSVNQEAFFASTHVPNIIIHGHVLICEKEQILQMNIKLKAYFHQICYTDFDIYEISVYLINNDLIIMSSNDICK